MKYRGNWKTRFGFYFAAIGSAFGLGNLWRFPYVVAENGGGAFVLLYIFLAFFIGVPILVAELILGKQYQQSIMGVLHAKTKEHLPEKIEKKWLLLGKVAVLLSLLVLSYYAVISGWVLHFFMQFLVGAFRTESFDAAQSLLVLRQSGGLQIGLASVHLLLTIMIVLKGLQNGVEKWIGYLMPVFAILLMTLVIKSLSLENSSEALSFLFYPDFSKLSVSSLGQALGHMLFTLSLGFGVMVTFGSYMKRDSYIPEEGLRVFAMDTVISLLSGLLIFPLVFTVSGLVHKEDVLFETLPLLFGQTSGGHWFGIAFFLCLYIASLGASIGLLEVIVSNLGDRWKVQREKACWVAGGIAFLVSIFPGLSSSALGQWSYRGLGVLQILDLTIINWMLPLSALGLCFLVGRSVSRDKAASHFLLTSKPDYAELFQNWRSVIRWVAPLVIIVALLLQVFDIIRS